MLDDRIISVDTVPRHESSNQGPSLFIAIIAVGRSETRTLIAIRF